MEEQSAYVPSAPRRGRPKPTRNTGEFRDGLVLNNMGLVGMQVRRLYRIHPDIRRTYPADDAWQDAVSGLIRAADLWDPDRAVFSTYAVHSIRQVLYRKVEEMHMIRVPEHVYRQLYRGDRDDWHLLERKVMLLSQLGRRGRGHDTQMHEPHAREMSVPDQAHLRDGCRRVRRMLRLLPGRFGYVLERRWLCEESLAAVAADMGVTKERVRQIEVKGLKMLRRRLIGSGYGEFF